jgi:subtilase family serine protease
MNRRCRSATGPRLERLDERLLLSALTPAQIDSAYGLNAITFAKGAFKGDGAGQTIAIIDVDYDPSIFSDLVAFDAKNNLPNLVQTATPSATGLFPNGQSGFTALDLAGTTTNPTWNEEEALDVEMAHATAPRASIVLVEAKTAGVYDFINAIQAAKAMPDVAVISMSWGGPEFQGQQQFDSVFTTPYGHQGITFLASSGDEGAGDQWPASSPNVISVGGTSLAVNSTGARLSESAWSGSGGGASQIVTKPAYQAGVVSGSMRSTPDVSSVADPGTGVMITTAGNQALVGGTSMSAPLWAGLFAIADEGLAIAGKPKLYGPAQVLPALYKAPANAFYDVKTGPRSTTGYDTSTGLGSPNGATLIAYLDGTSLTTTGTGTGTGTTTTTTTTVGTKPSTSPAIVSPVVGQPTVGSVLALFAPVATSDVVTPSLVAIPLSIAIDPDAAESVLSRWNLGSSVAHAKGRG